jgi:hypothetical protein
MVRSGGWCATPGPLDFNWALGGSNPTASFENPPNGGIRLPNLEAAGLVTFNDPASTISNNYTDDPSQPHL